MENIKIQLTITELQTLLDEQKKLTVEKCLSESYIYNQENSGINRSYLPIDEVEFRRHGMSTPYPTDFNILKKYIK